MSPVQRGEHHDATPSSRAGVAGRAPEGATFSGRIDRRRSGPPIFVIAFVLLLGGVVAIAIAGRAPAGAGRAGTSGVAASPAASPATAVASRPPATFMRDPSDPFPLPSDAPQASPGSAPIVASVPGGPISLQLRRHPETMFVHGDVLAPGVTWVFVALIDDTGRVAGWTSVSVPGGAGAAPGGRPTLRFDVELAMPDWAVSSRLWLQATAYDSSGAVVGTERLGIQSDGSPVAARLSPRAPMSSGPPGG